MNRNIIYKQDSHCLCEEMDGELLVYQPTSATTLHLNGPSAIVWNLCTGENTVQEMIDIVVDAFPDQAEQIPQDIIDVMQGLVTQRFVVEVVD